jgi:hypothetical protein
MFLSNPKYVAEISNAKITQNNQIIKTVSLHKNGESSYSSEPFVVPPGEFKIFIEGSDSNKNPILREFTVDIIQNLFESITVKGENPSQILDAIPNAVAIAYGGPEEKSFVEIIPTDSKTDKRKIKCQYEIFNQFLIVSNSSSNCCHFGERINLFHTK